MHEATWTREQAIAFLDDPHRLASEDPRRLWTLAELGPGMTVVDVGAGSGFYALPACEFVGGSGQVYAVDISRALVEFMQEKARSQGLENLRVVRSRPGRIPLPDGIADRLLLANVIHGIPPETLSESVRVLRPGGRFLDVDWKKEPTEGGPPVEHRLTVRESQRLLREYGLRPISDVGFGASHYVVILEKLGERTGRTRAPGSQ